MQTPQTPGPDPGTSTPAPHGPKLLRIFVAAALLIAITATIHLTGAREWLQDVNRLRQTLSSLGPWAYPACIVAVALLVACGLPRLLFCALGAALLGFWPGLLLTQGGALLGSYAVFLLVRWGQPDWVIRRWPKLARFADFVQDRGVGGVILARQLPLHGTLINLCLGLSRVKHRHFLLGSAIGLLPEAVPVALIGAGLLKADPKTSAMYLAAGAIAFVLLWIAFGYWLRTLRASRPAAPLPHASHPSTE